MKVKPLKKKVKEQKRESQESDTKEKNISKLKEDLKIIEDAFKEGIIDENAYKENKNEIRELLNHHTLKKRVSESSENMDNLLLEIEEFDEFKLD